MEETIQPFKRQLEKIWEKTAWTLIEKIWEKKAWTLIEKIWEKKAWTWDDDCKHDSEYTHTEVSNDDFTDNAEDTRVTEYLNWELGGINIGKPAIQLNLTVSVVLQDNTNVWWVFFDCQMN
ncbi:hypothetical protein HAX54_011241 [Datura stramonium]|uniref:Uncharacterized protein n=1 Tax=Datura stramonium TaxID=4076 RepID=A0ABS8THK5_DATST|nr:hypothetical protein [Datura stramonium]